MIRTMKSGTDIRGKAVGEDARLSGEVAFKLGAAYALWLRQKGIDSPRIALGRDSRLTGEALADACAQGIASVGGHAEHYGLCTTPAMFMCLITEGFEPDASIMVTASHHPSDRNGFKFITRSGGLSGAELDAIIDLAEGELPVAEVPGTITGQRFLPVYCEQLAERVRTELDTDVAKPLLGLHVVVDAGNGAGGFYAGLLESLGAWVEGSQFLTPDGNFPGHIPNPENPEAMASISAAVRKQGADLGVIFDADCDRAAIVDQTGREINRNRLIALISAILLNKQSGLTIVTDSVTSSGLARFITEWGGEHYRFKRGYRNVIEEAIRLNEAGIDCPLAIETSGHAALRDNHFLDDGMYLVTLLICEAMRLKQEGKQLASMLTDLREPVESAELRLKITEEDFRAAGRAAIEKVMDHASFQTGWHIAPDNREGIRINFDLDNGLDNGWFLLRLSVHDPVLPLNIESDVKGGVLEMANNLLNVLQDTDGIDLSVLQNFISQQEASHV